MRAFILRRVALISRGFGDVVLLGSNHCQGTIRIREFLTRNGHPYTMVDLDDLPGHFPAHDGESGATREEVHFPRELAGAESHDELLALGSGAHEVDASLHHDKEAHGVAAGREQFLARVEATAAAVGRDLIHLGRGQPGEHGVRFHGAQYSVKALSG
jgi:hypothetical protein